jgi:lysyl-tRNA synthetase class I
MNGIQIIVDKGMNCFLTVQEREVVREIKSTSQRLCERCGKYFSARRWREHALGYVYSFVCECGKEYTLKDAAVRHRVVG